MAIEPEPEWLPAILKAPKGRESERETDIKKENLERECATYRKRKNSSQRWREKNGPGKKMKE